MEKEKDRQKLSDIFFGKADELLTNTRRFLRFKKRVKIARADEEKIGEVRKKLVELYGRKIGGIREIGEEKKKEFVQSPALSFADKSANSS